MGNSQLRTCSTLFMKQVLPRLLRPRSPSGSPSAVFAGAAEGTMAAVSPSAGKLVAVPQLMLRGPFAGSARQAPCCIAMAVASQSVSVSQVMYKLALEACVATVLM